MSYVAAAIAGSAVVGYVDQQNAANSARSAQEGATRQAQQYNEQAYQRESGLLNPYITQGQTAYDNLNSGKIQLDPGYQFRLNEGMKAIDNATAARGMYGSGAALKQIARYGQDYASNEYQNAWNRQQTLANYGFNASQALANNAGGYASNASNNAIGLGNAQAASQISSANNFNSTVGNLAQAGAMYYGYGRNPSNNYSFNQPSSYESPSSTLNYWGSK
jgi:hypothetical protein